MQIGRPEALVARGREPRRGQVIDQCVEPDVDRLLGIAGEGDAPRQALPRNGHILQAVLEQPHDFVSANRGLDAEFLLRDQLQQALAIGAEPEEVIPFLGMDQLERGMLDAVTIGDLRRLLELLTAGAVQALVVRDIQVIGMALLDTLEQGHHAAYVAGLGGPDPVIVAALEPAPVVGERRGHAIDPFAWRDAGACGRLDNRLTVLVHPHQVMDLIAPQPMIPGDAVGADFLQRVPQVRIAVGVIDRGREEVLRARHSACSWSSVTTRVSPASERRVTRSRKMSTATTFSMPTGVRTAFPSFGKRLRCCT